MRDFTSDLRDVERRLGEAETYLSVSDNRERFAVLEAEISDPALRDDQERAKKLNTEYANIRDDLAVFEQVGEVLAANTERYSQVTLFLPSDLSMTLDVCGVPVGFAHGHVARGSGHPVQKIEKWWTGQVMGFQPVADARILVTGHYHHLLLSESTGRTHMQCPAMDGGSAWWTSSTGQSSPAGVLSFVVSLWWIGMLVVQSRHGAPVLDFSETLEDVSRNSTGTR